MSQLSGDQSQYDLDEDADAETREHITRYGQEVMEDKVNVIEPKDRLGSLGLHLEDGPQVFEKESEDADKSIR